jgi:hypothetical protein
MRLNENDKEISFNRKKSMLDQRKKEIGYGG